MITTQGIVRYDPHVTQAKVEVVWVLSPVNKPLIELEEVFFATHGHGLPMPSNSSITGTMAGVVIATQKKPSFIVSLMDVSGRCFVIDLQNMCQVCLTFIVKGAKTNFIVLTNCVSSICPSKGVFRSKATQTTEISLLPSIYTRMVCPVVPYHVVPGILPFLSFWLPFDSVPYFTRRIGAIYVKYRTIKVENASIHVFGDELNNKIEHLWGQKCLLTSCVVVGTPNSDFVTIKSTRSSMMAKASCAHFRMREIPV